MSSSARASLVNGRALDPKSLDGIHELVLQSTSESLEQAVVRLEEVREQLAATLNGLHQLALTGAELDALRQKLVRLQECAVRGDQMVSGRLQLFYGPDLLYDRKASPSADFFPSRVQLEG